MANAGQACVRVVDAARIVHPRPAATNKLQVLLGARALGRSSVRHSRSHRAYVVRVCVRRSRGDTFGAAHANEMPSIVRPFVCVWARLVGPQMQMNDETQHIFGWRSLGRRHRSRAASQCVGLIGFGCNMVE